jgi:hypothetical protein
MRLTHFGTYVFPLFSKRDQVSVGDTSGAIVGLAGRGYYDAFGTDDATEQLRTVATEYEIIETTATAVQTARDAIRGRSGQLLRLWADLPDGTSRFQWARLAKVDIERRREYLFYQPVSLQFEVAEPGWNGTAHGATWYLDSGHYLDTGKWLDTSETWTPSASGDTYTLTNDGVLRQTDAQITITAGAASISSIRLRVNSCDWTYGGTVAAGQSLIVDCGAKSIKNNAVDDYANLTLNAGHTVGDWIQIEPGDNTVTINYSGNAGADAVVTWDYYDAWA